MQTTTVATSIGGVYDVPDRLTGREAVAELSVTTISYSASSMADRKVILKLSSVADCGRSETGGLSRSTCLTRFARRSWILRARSLSS